tara:strand:- start:2001 stop:2627 length:627 start_codon:yes stop_codon:yes gene_type:complete
MIKLKSIYVDNMIYGDPSQKYLTKMKGDLGPFNNFDVNLYKSSPPPTNSSQTVKDELNHIQGIERDEKFIKKADRVENYFKSFMDEWGLEFPKKYVKHILKCSRPIILKLKYYYNRPRPDQLADHFGLPLDNFFLDSMGTPAYPSGHSTQGILIGLLLGDMFPQYKEELFKIGKDISYSRLMSKAHYPSDSEFGEQLGKDLYNKIKND